MTEKSITSDDISSTLDNYGNKKFQDPLSAIEVESIESEVSNNSEYATTIDSDNEEGPMSTSTSTSYRDEWMRLFGQNKFTTFIRKEGMKGRLRSSRFRSVCWRVFLQCLPDKTEEWSKELKESRKKYEKLKKELLLNPKSELQDQTLDPLLNNPLSQDEESPWNRFFQDKVNRQEIHQDVIRCFPEIAFFQKQGVQDMMLNLLFCYSREYPDISYKQGMHEVLAPLIFVLHSDHQAFLHAKEMESHLPLVAEVLDDKYLEHDSYIMFSKLMETMEPWYQFGEPDFCYPNNKNILHSTPFAKPPEICTSPVVKKLEKIHSIILRYHDKELYEHLTRLEIQPQIYGIRWVRLLFGREFPLQDLLVLWDSIFADSFTLDLTDYFVVAMLTLVRELLLRGDNSACLNLLMHFPTTDDVHFLINKALHLRNPLKHSRPANYQFQIFHQSRTGNYLPQPSRATPKLGNSSITVGGSNNIRNKTSSVVTSGFNSLRRITTKTEAQARMTKSKTDEDLSSQPPLLSSDIKEVKSRPLPVRAQSVSDGLHVKPEGKNNLHHQSHNNLESIFGRPRSSSKKANQKEDQDLQKEAAVLKGRLNDTENMCRYCSTKMEAHLLQIQDALVRVNSLKDDDDLLIAVAGLKQVKDILNGTLRFAAGVIDGEDTLSMSNNYFSQEEINRNVSVKHDDQSRETWLDATKGESKAFTEWAVPEDNSDGLDSSHNSKDESECPNNNDVHE